MFSQRFAMGIFQRNYIYYACLISYNAMNELESYQKGLGKYTLYNDSARRIIWFITQ